MKIIRYGMLGLLMILLLCACSEKGKAVSDTNNPEPAPVQEEPVEVEAEQEVEEEVQEPEFTNVYPLTGVPTNEAIDHRVISVMVNNHTKARPQTGLSKADIVFEVLAEGQITRFLAVYHSEIPDKIGPVRSARPYYFQLAAGFDALYLYHGAAEFINNQIASSGIDYLNGSHYDNNGWLFERSTERDAPHNSYLITSGLAKAIDAKGFDTSEEIEPLPFMEKGETVNGDPVSKVRIVYGSREAVTFTKDNGQFLRSSDGKPSTDSANQKRLAVENVLIVSTEHAVVDSAGRREIDLTSGGTGYLLQKGTIKEIEWQNVDGRILPFKDGEPLAFVPGQTWVNIIPEQAAVEVTN